MTRQRQVFAASPSVTVHVTLPKAKGIGSMSHGSILFLLLTSPIWFPFWLPCWLVYQAAVLTGRALPVALLGVAGLLFVMLLVGAFKRASPDVASFAPAESPPVALKGSLESGVATPAFAPVQLQPAKPAAPISLPASPAKRTYTPAKLSALVKAGRPPKLGPGTTQAQHMDYVVCVVALNVMVDAVRPYYPSQTVAGTRTKRVERFWTNDSMVTLTCDATTSQQTIATEPYI